MLGEIKVIQYIAFLKTMPTIQQLIRKWFSIMESVGSKRCPFLTSVSSKKYVVMPPNTELEIWFCL